MTKNRKENVLDILLEAVVAVLVILFDDRPQILTLNSS